MTTAMLGGYELYYQDSFGAWHLTRFTVAPGGIECTFEFDVSRVPPEVQAQAAVKAT